MRAQDGSIHVEPGNHHPHLASAEGGLCEAEGLLQESLRRNFPSLSINIWESTLRVLTHLGVNHSGKICHKQRCLGYSSGDISEPELTWWLCGMFKARLDGFWDNLV